MACVTTLDSSSCSVCGKVKPGNGMKVKVNPFVGSTSSVRKNDICSVEVAVLGRIA